MAFKKTKQEALDLLQEKEKRLAELTEESAYAVQMVQNTIDNLQVVNSDIQTTMDEIDTYIQVRKGRQLLCNYRVRVGRKTSVGFQGNV